MGEKFKLKKKQAKEPKISKQKNNGRDEKDSDRNDLEPLFSFKHLDLEESLKGCDKDVYLQFVHRLQKLSSLDWKTINASGKHQYGFERIPIKQLRPRKLPSIVTDEMKSLIAFRYAGDNRPFICLIQSGVIFPIFIEAKFGDIYDHGSK